MTEKKNIVFIQPSYAHYRKQLFKILSQRHDITFLFERSLNTYPGKIEPTEISHRFLDRMYRNFRFGLIHYLIKKKPDIVISSISSSLRSLIAYVYSLLFKKQFILWIEEWRKPTCSPYLIKRLWRNIKNKIGTIIIRNCHALVVGGSASKEYALSLGKNDSDIFVAIQCANDLKKHFDIKNSKKNDVKKKFIFLYMSRIVSFKGLDILIKAYARLRKKRTDVFLLIGGDGPFRQFCQDLATSLKIEDVSFSGSVDPLLVADLYNQADVFILPSHFNDIAYESWGLVVNEAMSFGLPIITTTAVGAAYDLVTHGFNGLVVKEGNVVDLCSAMESIINLDYAKMGMNSRLLFEEKNNFTHMANSFSSAIQHTDSNVKQAKHRNP